jgi:hypothetical protein
VLQAMLALSDTGHLLRFVQRDNHVDPQVGPHARAHSALSGFEQHLVLLGFALHAGQDA